MHHGLCLVLAAIGGACELLAAFGVSTPIVDLIPLGLVFLMALVALHHHAHA